MYDVGYDDDDHCFTEVSVSKLKEFARGVVTLAACAAMRS